MKHVKALVVKAIMIWAILWVVLTGLYGVSFMDSTIVGVIIVVMIYVLGELQHYVKEYYRYRLLYSMKKMQQMLLNGKLGAVCTQLYELYDLFGVRTEEGMLIDFSITNEEIAKFCGISTASSVNRILKQLKKDGIITVKDHHIVILNMDLLEDNIIF